MSLIEKLDNLGAPISESQVKCIGYPINIANTILVLRCLIFNDMWIYFIINSSGIGMDMNCAFFCTRDMKIERIKWCTCQDRNKNEGWSCCIKFDFKVMSLMNLWGVV